MGNHIYFKPRRKSKSILGRLEMVHLINTRLITFLSQLLTYTKAGQRFTQVSRVPLAITGTVVQHLVQFMVFTPAFELIDPKRRKMPPLPSR